MTNDTIFTHVPMCFNCNTREVAGAFSNAHGEGFCSAECEREAHAEMDTRDSEEPVEESMGEDAAWDAFLSQFDNDPDVYSGTYSEE